MKSAHEKRNWKTIEDEAHALKSSSGSFGAIKLQAFAREIELAAINKNIDTMDKIMPTLEDLIHLSIAELETLISRN